MASPDGLIGHTGFVGSNLARHRRFDEAYNSKNIATIRGRRFGTLVCAGVPAVKWLANKEPAQDRDAIEGLKAHLDTVEAQRLVLVSTVDVYPDPIGVTERDQPPRDAGQPYGRHRLLLEDWVASRFPGHLILRLPALFGPGLKKNIIFDLVNGNQVDRISPNGVFQWYPLRRFAADVERALASGLRVLNLAVEPVPTTEIVRRFFPGAALGGADLPAASYDMWTDHAALLGGGGRYHLDAAESLRELGAYLSGDAR